MNEKFFDYWRRDDLGGDEASELQYHHLNCRKRCAMSFKPYQSSTYRVLLGLLWILRESSMNRLRPAVARAVAYNRTGACIVLGYAHQ